MKLLRTILLFWFLFAAAEQAQATCAFRCHQMSSGNPKAIYFIHNNHLGSASWITNKTGVPAQYIHYAPYGELIANQRATSYDERYKFIGKERDEESGYDNFGARYYIPPLGIWTRVDPLVNKYLHVSPYMYCEGNPVRYKDPNGKWVQMVVGAVVSGAADAALQVGEKMLDGQSLSESVKNIDMRQVAGSALAGAIGVGVVSKVSQVAKIYRLGKTGTSMAKTIASPIGDAMGSVVSQEISKGEISAGQVKDDVIGGLVGNVAGKLKTNSLKTTAGYKRALKQLDHAERVANGSSKASRLQAVENAQNAVDNYGSTVSQTVSSGVSNVASEALKAQENLNNGNY